MAALFWVAGSTAYDGVTNRLATTSGGAASVAVIAAGDTVTFDANSPASAAVTTSAAISCTTLTLDTGFTGSLTMSNALTVSGTLTLTQGTLNTNNQTVALSIFSSSNSNTRTLTMGSSSITCSSTGTAWSMGTITNLTITANTATITFTGAATNWQAGSVSYNGASIVFTGSGAKTQVQTPTGINNLTITGTANKTDSYSTVGFTCTGTLNITGNSAINRILVFSSVTGTPRTLSAGAISLTNVDFMDITGAGLAGNAAWTGTSLGDALGNSNITFTTPATQTHTASAGGNWSDVTKWTSRVPLPQDDVVVDVNTTGALAMDMPRLGRNVTFAGFLGSTTSAIAVTAYGSWAWGAGMSSVGGGTISLSGRGAHVITSNGKSFPSSVLTSTYGGTYTLADALTITNAAATWSHLAGTFDSAGFAVTVPRTDWTGSVTRSIILGSSTLTLNGTSATLHNAASTGMTFSGASASIVISAAAATSRTFAGAGLTYGTLTYTVANSPGSLTITGANTFTNLNVGSGRILTMPASTTNTVTGSFNVNGAVNGYVYLPGLAANYISAPDSAALSITGDITIDVRVALDDWTPAAASVFVSKSPNASTNYSYDFFVNTGGTLTVRESLDGTVGALKSNTSSVATGLTDGAAKWLRASLDVDDGAGNRVCKFYMSDDGSAWTQLGTTQTTAGTTGAFDSTGALEIGSITTGATSLATGKFYNVKLYNSYLQASSGTPVFNADFTAKAFGVNSFTESSSNAATVTINGALAQAGDGRVSLVSSTPGTAAILTKPTGTVSVNYLTIQDSTAGVGWYAGANSVNVSNNKGWVFTAAPSNQGNFFPLM